MRSLRPCPPRHHYCCCPSQTSRLRPQWTRRKQTRLASNRSPAPCKIRCPQTARPSERAHCNSNYAVGNILIPQGFPALQPLFETYTAQSSQPGCNLSLRTSCAEFADF
ncbi:protein of unknown function [Paraburkholderia kururiensis]